MRHLFRCMLLSKMAGMADRDLLDGFQPSIFDRLTDADTTGTVDRRGYTEKQLSDAVRRDLEELMNTSRPEFPELGIADYNQVQTSVVGYGLPDFANLRTLGVEDKQAIARQIEISIAAFEPRLTDIQVILKDPRQLKEEMKEKFQMTALYFHIEAKLRMDPCPPITFETMLELTQGRHRIDGGIIE